MSSRYAVSAALLGLLVPWSVSVSAAAATPAAPTGVTSPAVARSAAAPSCSAFDGPVADRLNPKTGAQLLTTRAATEKGYAGKGFTADRGKPVTASGTRQAGLAAVHWLYRARSSDFFYTADAAEAARAKSRFGYQDRGIAFYASTTSADCLVPVYSFWRAGVHRFSTTPGERTLLHDSGWRAERVRFYLGRATADDIFTLGVVPDTQQEVLRAGDSRFANRSQWLVRRRQSLDLRFVTHSGDVVNWDTPDHIQYQRAEAALQPLATAGVPYSISPGNHDTAAVCPGGSACDTHHTRALVRQTASFNRYLATGTADLAGRFDAGKVDNTFSRFSAGGAPWLVLNLELWPRVGVVKWAQRVVASHPHDNVVVVTHSYLTAGGSIYASGSYGGVSPRYLYDHLIKVYPNVRVVLSGHVGTAAARTDRGQHGNRIVSLMLTMHDNVTNPVRLIEVNTTAGTLDTWVYAPYTDKSYPRDSRSYSGLDWLR